MEDFLPAAVAEELRGGRGRARASARLDLPLHAKPGLAGSVNYQKLLALPSHDPKVRAECEYQLGWMLDVTRYKNVVRRSARQVPVARMTREHVAKMLEVGHVIEVDEYFVRGGVKMFTVVAEEMERLRAIKHTEDANNVLPSSEPGHEVRMATKTTIVGLVHGGTHMAALDLASWFDQLPYAEEVSQLFCFQHEGKFYALPVASMGSRVSVSVASAVTWQLLNFERRSKRCEVVIDNVVFVGSEEDVEHDVLEFRRRCKEVGAVLNDVNVPVKEIVVQRGEWCGVHLDLVAKTTQLTPKLVSRTKLSMGLRAQWTWRGFAACVGLLFYSNGIIDCAMHRRFSLLSFVSRVSANLTEFPELWDEKCSIWPSAMRDIEEWAALVIENKPREVPTAHAAPEWIVATDASRWGWGYLAVKSNGEVRAHGERWSAQMERLFGDRLGASTFAEPHGVVNAMCHLIAPRDGVKRVRIATDNTATECSFNRGFSSHALHLNACIGRLQDTYVGTRFELVHIAGVLNPADPYSRGVSQTAAERMAGAERLRQVVG